MASKINPYQFLGIEKSNVCIKKLNETYYNYALLMHPENGGSIHEMAILEKCYNIVKNNQDSDVDLLTLSDKNIPKMYEIYDICVMDMSEFRKLPALYNKDSQELFETYENGKIENPHNCGTTLDYSYIF